MKAVKPRQMIKVLEQKGFRFVRQKGSHRLYRKEDLKQGTLQNILRQSGIKKEEI